MEPAYRVSDDIYALRTYFPVPTLGLVPVNAFVLQAREPVLIDTGLIAEHDQFMATLGVHHGSARLALALADPS